MSEKFRDFKGILAEYKVDDNEIENINNNNNNNGWNRGLSVDERRYIHGILLEFKAQMNWSEMCAAHLIDPRFSNTLMTEEERTLGMEELKKAIEIMYRDQELWEAGVRAQIMNIRASGGVFQRREFRSLGATETREDVINVYSFLKRDYQNSMVDYACTISIIFMNKTGTNDEVERSFNFNSLAENAQNNRLNIAVQDKKGFIWNSMHLRRRLHDWNVFLYELELN